MVYEVLANVAVGVPLIVPVVKSKFSPEGNGLSILYPVRIIFLMRYWSAIYPVPVASMYRPVGRLNNAVVPVPSDVPLAWVGLPATNVTAPSGVIFLMSLFK